MLHIRWKALLLRLLKTLLAIAVIAGVTLIIKNRLDKQKDLYGFVQPQAPVTFDFPLDKAGYKIDSTFWIVPKEKYDPENKTHSIMLRYIVKKQTDQSIFDRLDKIKVPIKVSLHRFDGKNWHPVPMYEYRKIENPDLDGPTGESIISKSNIFQPGSYSATESGNENILHLKSRITFFFYTPGQYHLTAEVLNGNPIMKNIRSQLFVDQIFNGK